MRNKKLFASLAVLSAALIWGISFTAQKSAMSYLTPLVFTSMRSLLGALTLIPVIVIADRFRGETVFWWGSAKTCAARKKLVTGGIFCGIFLAGGLIFQQSGMISTPAGKSGFLTALYIIIVPVLGALFFKRKTGLRVWLACFAALAGTYLLCTSTTADSSFDSGDILVIICAVIFSLHLLVIDKYAPETDCIRLSCIQFLTAGVIAFVISLTDMQSWSTEALYAALWMIVYCGVMASGVGFTLQIIGQKYLAPATAALLMSMESVFSLIASWLILKEHLSGGEMLGCAIIFFAVIIAQITPGKNSGTDQ